MALKQIDGALLREMLISGTALLQKNKDEINALNVFPVPDGDTGTNMLMTVQSAIREVQKLGASNSLQDIGEAMSRGSLKGARGNSGVILSQIFRGFYQSFKDGSVVDANGLAKAFKGSTDTAYKAVMKPREGTMLTVCRAVSDEAQKACLQTEELTDIMQRSLKVGYATLARTPEMLDVLKRAGVVDAGGKGLLMIFEGFYRAMLGLQAEEPLEVLMEAAPAAHGGASTAAGASQEAIEFGYCTEFIITNLKPELTDKDVNKLHGQLDEMGDSIVLVRDDDIIKIHVHSNRPGLVLEYAMACGDLINVKIDNMREQHNDLLEIAASGPAEETFEQRETAIVSVVSGKGFEKIFRDLGVDGFVSGGQTMNPSTEDIVEAIQAVRAKTVYVLPNNSNIIEAARLTVDLVVCQVVVIPSKSIPQGLAAVLAFNPEADAQENEQAMTAALKTVKTGQVTYAVRDTEFDGIKIRQGDIMGLSNGSICATGTQAEEVALALCQQMADEDSEIITVFYGQDVAEEKALELTAQLEEAFPDYDVECHSGGQPVYYYILSVE